MYLGTNLDNVFYEYAIPMTEDERKEMQDMLIADASELLLGINMKDPVPHIANDSTYLNLYPRLLRPATITI